VCACKHRDRTARRFDGTKRLWVAGITPSDHGRRYLLYLMLVRERYESQFDLWESLSAGAQAAKSASKHWLGDVYEPKRARLEDDERFDVGSYHEPRPGHAHRSTDAPRAWHEDIAYRRGRPWMLVGDPRLSYIWSEPSILLDEPDGPGRETRNPAGHSTSSLPDSCRQIGDDASRPSARRGRHGRGGISGPVLADGGFEFVPIPDNRRLDERTYGNTRGRFGRPLVEYFPERRRVQQSAQSMHVDPEFETFTYGDPTRPKQRLRELQAGDLSFSMLGSRSGRATDRHPASTSSATSRSPSPASRPASQRPISTAISGGTSMCAMPLCSRSSARHLFSSRVVREAASSRKPREVVRKFVEV